MKTYQTGVEGGEYLYPGAGDASPLSGRKVQLLTVGGIHTSGPWRTDGAYLGWLPLPKRNLLKEELCNAKR